MFSSHKFDQVTQAQQNKNSDETRRLLERWASMNDARGSEQQPARQSEPLPVPEMPMRNFLRVVFTR